MAMGLSLGEYSALCFAGCFSFEDGVRITRARGEAMQAASQQAPSGMVAVVGLNEPAVLKLVDRICEEAGSNSIFVANYLSDHNFTLAGSESACKAATAIGRSHGAKLVRALPVSGAFHTRYMETAAAALSDAVNAADFKVPTIPVMSNVTGRPHDFDCNKIKEKLIQQLVEPVKWSQSLNWVLSNTVTDQVDVCEVGPGTVCSDLVKKYSKVKSPLLSIRCLPA